MFTLTHTTRKSVENQRDANSDTNRYTCGGNIESGQTCDVYCKTGYDAYEANGEFAIDGTGTATCMTGEWINLPSCVPSDCYGPPPQIQDADESWVCGELAENPATSEQEYRVKNGESCEIQCRDGFTSNIRHTTNSTRCLFGKYEYTNSTIVPVYKHGT